MRRPALPAAALLICGAATAVADEPRFSNVFQSHMVLQRDQPLGVWGVSAGANETLRVCFGSRGSAGSLCRRTASSAGGLFRAEFPPQTASAAPRELWVIRERDGQGSLLEDIVVGDVFLFTGQSNIDIPEAYGHQVAPLRQDPRQSGAAAQAAEEARAEMLGKTGLLRLRIVDVPDSFNATEGQPELPAMPACGLCPPPFAIGNYSWCQCSQMAWARPSAVNIRGFSATSWFAAVALLDTAGAHLTGVPLGVVRSSKGGSTIDLWSSAEARARCPPPPPAPGPPPAPCLSPALCPGSLWSMMMAPFAGVKFKAITWCRLDLHKRAVHCAAAPASFCSCRSQ
jgi:hypothetical protein